jgi:hypothetical protein
MKLQIPEPCSQKWEQMAFIDDTKRFCSECSKNIVDFSKKSDKEIVQHLLKNPDKICGKLSPHQLNRKFRDYDVHFPGLKALLLAGTLTVFSNQFHSQVSETKIEQQQIKVDTNIQVIRGNIKDTGHTFGIYDLVVELPQYKLFCKSDLDGNFQFSVSAHDLPDSIALIVRKGNAYKTFKGLNSSEFINLEVCLIPILIDANFIQETQLIGLVVVKPKWYQFGFKLKRLWYRIFR